MQSKPLTHSHPSLSMIKFKFAQSFAQSSMIKEKAAILLGLLKKLLSIFISNWEINIYGEIRLFSINS